MARFGISTKITSAEVENILQDNIRKIAKIVVPVESCVFFVTIVVDCYSCG